MLSRAAGSLYWTGRHLERASYLARLVEVHNAAWLDRSTNPRWHTYWPSVVHLAGHPLVERITAREAIEVLVASRSGPSVRASMETARQMALAFRPSISTEVYEQLNTLYWQLEESDRSRDLHGLLNRVELGVYLIFGLVEETMSHDEAWDFLRLGRHFERASNVTRLVTTRAVELGEAGDDPVEWAAVLRSCSAFEAYRQRYSAPVTPRRVAGFLLLDTMLPRSAAHCVTEAAASIARIDGSGQRSRPHRLLGQIAAQFDYAEEREVVAHPTEFAASFRQLALAVDEALLSTYFQPSRIATDAVPPPPAWAQPQQQQQ
jgi:uncharacterized alpha-E superfamily protein